MHKRTLMWCLERRNWLASDPQILAEILFSVANVLSFARTTYVMPSHELLGPLQVSPADRTTTGVSRTTTGVTSYSDHCRCLSGECSPTSHDLSSSFCSYVLPPLYFLSPNSCAVIHCHIITTLRRQSFSFRSHCKVLSS